MAAVRSIRYRKATGNEGEPPPPSLWAFGGLPPLRLMKRVWKEYNEDDVASHAAQLAYYFMLALFPAMLFLVTLIGLIAHGNPSFQQQLFAYLARLAPGSASELISKTIQEVTQAAGGLKLTFGIVFTIWSAMGGIVAIMTSLNAAYDVKEGRPLWKRYGIALGLTIALSVLAIVALAVVLFGGRIADYLGSHLPLGSVAVTTWTVVQWPLAFALMAFAFALIYYFAPDVKEQKWYWITPGSLLGVVIWLGASALFRLYLAYFNNYAKTYGSIGAVIILMLWLYITGTSIMLGGEVNSEIEHAAAEQGRADAKAEGEKQAPAA
ncbi:MAG TPA: YihY/virulence factor BrkB family protein [Terriglobales bacterium]|nr:YihY/virulence factor BrkB family protein [Terriglobales bacterium]